MAAAPFDTLKLARALRDRAGFSQEHAEAAADALAESLAEQVATKQDVKEFYLGLSASGRKSYRDAKFYRRRKRWLA